MIGKHPKNLLDKIKNQTNKLAEKAKTVWKKLNLQDKVEYCRNFLHLQASIEVHNIVETIKDPQVTDAAYKIIKYFESQEIYIKKVLKSKDLIRQADICIDFLSAHPEYLNKILLDTNKLKKAVVIIGFFKETIDKRNTESFLINDGLLEEMYLKVSEDISKKNDDGKKIQMSDFKNRQTYGYYSQLLPDEEEESKGFSID